MREKILDYLNREDYKPLRREELAAALQPADPTLLEKTLHGLEQEGVVVVNRKGRIGLCGQMGLLAGTISGNSRGFAFFLSDDRSRRDIYVHFDNLAGAMHGDRVLLRITKEHKYVNGHEEGEVVRILARNTKTLVGVLDEGTICFVRCDDHRYFQDVLIPRDACLKARDGDRVVVKLTRYPDGRRGPEGRITEVLGAHDDAAIDVLTVIRKHCLPEAFPARVEENATAVAKMAEEDYADRLDLRELVTVTIDGADAKDLDDAVSLERLPGGAYRLGVHIADVAHYVRRGSPLDREAWSRGTSVYLPDRVIPMLPRALSNDICSLNPQVDRLTLSCLMEVDSRGRVRKQTIAESVIRTTARMTYADVNAILDGDEAVSARYEALCPMFLALDELREALFKKRERRGAITFDFPEAKAVCDEKGNVLAIEKRLHGRAESIIEECMILANETVASVYFERDIPFIYRVHETPPDEKVLDLRAFLGLMGYSLRGRVDDLRPLAYQRLLRTVAGKPESYLIEQSILRSMSHARYDVENDGHFGLASECYCHFTSPIRRYPDLAIHRQIKDVLHGNTHKEKTYKRLQEAAVQSSLRERVAEEAEREAVDIKKARFMADHVGEVFDGVIAGVVNFGFFVELDNTVQGLVHVSTLEDDFYEFHETRRCLVGRRGSRKFALGDAVRIRVTRVNIEEHLIDFELSAE